MRKYFKINNKDINKFYPFVIGDGSLRKLFYKDLEIENLKLLLSNKLKEIEKLEYLLKVSDKALDIACNEGDLYWFELHALHENISMIDYVKNLAIDELNKGSK